MKDFFIIANSFAAPFFSDSSNGYEQGKTAKEALQKFVNNYTHPAGLYSARVFASADDYHKGKPFLAEYLCNKEIAIKKAKKGKGAYAYYSERDDTFEIDHKKFTVTDPRKGKIL